MVVVSIVPSVVVRDNVVAVLVSVIVVVVAVIKDKINFFTSCVRSVNRELGESLEWECRV